MYITVGNTVRHTLVVQSREEIDEIYRYADWLIRRQHNLARSALLPSKKPLTRDLLVSVKESILECVVNPDQDFDMIMLEHMPLPDCHVRIEKLYVPG
jgi:hypothetical protein